MRVFVTSKSFGRAAPDALDLLKDNGIDVVFAAKRTMTTPEIAAEIRGYDALIVGNDTVDASVFAAADRLRLVHMHGTGLDAIDVKAATASGVLVANAPGVNRNAVAELTLALMLIAARSIDHNIGILRSGGWDRSVGYEISGKTVGMLGLGNIGQRIVELLSGFGVHVVGFDLQPDMTWVTRFGVELAKSPEEVFAVADFLVLALTLNATTRGIVDARRLALMKRNAFLINTARGGLIDETALCDAIRGKSIAGAALDAFDPEPLPADSPLRQLDIVLTPHLAATSHESAANVSRVVARNVIDVLLRQHIDCAVNSEAIAARAVALD